MLVSLWVTSSNLLQQHDFIFSRLCVVLGTLLHLHWRVGSEHRQSERRLVITSALTPTGFLLHLQGCFRAGLAVVNEPDCGEVAPSKFLQDGVAPTLVFLANLHRVVATCRPTCHAYNHIDPLARSCATIRLSRGKSPFLYPSSPSFSLSEQSRPLSLALSSSSLCFRGGEAPARCTQQKLRHGTQKLRTLASVVTHAVSCGCFGKGVQRTLRAGPFPGHGEFSWACRAGRLCECGQQGWPGFF